MDIRSRLIQRFTGFCVALLLLFFVRNVSAAITYAHSQTVQNNTGQTVNDLHVDTFYGPTGDAPTAPPFDPGTFAGQTITFPSTGGVVGAGEKVKVSWTSKNSGDVIDFDTSGNLIGSWTLNDKDVGKKGTVGSAANLRQIFEDLGGGMMLLLVENMGANAVTYTDLGLFNGADAAFFTPGDFVDGLLTGIPVDLLTPSDGIFDPGFTQLAKFSPTRLHNEYWGVSVRIDGDLFADAGRNDVSAPPTWTLLSLGVLLLLVVRRSEPGSRLWRAAADGRGRPIERFKWRLVTGVLGLPQQEKIKKTRLFDTLIHTC